MLFGKQTLISLIKHDDDSSLATEKRLKILDFIWRLDKINLFYTHHVITYADCTEESSIKKGYLIVVNYHFIKSLTRQRVKKK